MPPVGVLEVLPVLEISVHAVHLPGLGTAALPAIAGCSRLHWVLVAGAVLPTCQHPLRCLVRCGPSDCLRRRFAPVGLVWQDAAP